MVFLFLMDLIYFYFITMYNIFILLYFPIIPVDYIFMDLFSLFLFYYQLYLLFIIHSRNNLLMLLMLPINLLLHLLFVDKCFNLKTHIIFLVSLAFHYFPVYINIIIPIYMIIFLMENMLCL